MQIESLDGPGSDPAWCQAWDAALSDSDPLSPFLARAWLSAWRASYGKDCGYRLVTASDSGELRAGLPMIFAPLPVSGFTVPGFKYAASALTGRAGPWLADAKHDGVCGILHSLSTYEQRWVAFDIPDLVAGSPANRVVLAAARASGMPVRAVPGRASPYIECEDTFTVWLAKRSRNFKSNRNRKLNRLSREGQVEFVECLGGKAVRNVLPDLFETSRRSWKGKIGADMAASEASRQFFGELGTCGERTHDLDAWLLRVGGRVIAVQVYWGNGFRKCLLRSDFCESEAALSPGDVLQLHVIERYHDLGVREIDLGGQDYGYKMRLTGLIREHVSLRIFRPSIVGRSIFIGSSAIGRLRSVAARLAPAAPAGAEND